ncbi:MAG TPA: spore coat protein U domain-containing protein [Candidatus Rubrimentiphilum sp.]|nr:spore coat protein U domain-containing protein [Candidatus Rubrimentiphilum sp.]
MRRHVLWIVAFACLAIVLWPHRVQAAPLCGFTSSPSVLFGNYDVYGAAVSSTGTINGLCTAGSSSTVRPIITLSKGGSTTYHPRKMACTSGACLTNGDSADVVTYNLYTTAAHATIWGNPTLDATTASVQLASGCCANNVAFSATVFGFIPAAISGGANDVSVGGYTDTIVVTMTF